jgi:hypothetical protein
MKKYRLSIIIIMLATCGAFFLTGCATSEQARSVEKSGFLGDYSQLKKGGGKHYEGSTDNWADIKQACDRWAQKMSTELQKRRTK